MTLANLLEGSPHKLLQGCKDVQVARIVYDSRQVTPQSLFIALTGNRVDGHQHVADHVLPSDPVPSLGAHPPWASVRARASSWRCLWGSRTNSLA